MNRDGTGVSSGRSAAGVGAAFVAAAAVGGGIYYFYGTNGAEHRRQFKKTVATMSRGAHAVMTEFKAVNSDIYEAAIDSLQERYGFLKDLDWASLGKTAKDLHDHWRAFQSRTSSSRSAASRRRPARRARTQAQGA